MHKVQLVGRDKISPRTDLKRLLEAVVNMSAFHREHEKFYSSAPREQPVILQRHSRALLALADRGRRPNPRPILR